MNVLYQIAKPFQEIFQDQFFTKKISSPEFFRSLKIYDLITAPEIKISPRKNLGLMK